MYKKKDRHDKPNYTPVRNLPLLSKPFERILYEQIDNHSKNILSKYQRRFQKKLSFQHSILAMFEKWKKILDNGGSCGALLVDLSKAFDCIVHDISLAKLSAYGFDYNSLKLINSFLSARKLKMETGSSYSPYLGLLVGVPRESILGPLLCNICMCDIFLCDCKTNINYADDNTLYACEPNMRLEKDTSTVFTWFQNNYLKANSGKSHLLTTSDNIQHINVGVNQLSSSKYEELLGILIDHKLTFENHLLNIVQKVNQKLQALARISKYIPRKKLRIIMKAFVSSQFAYCPLIWMFHSRQINHKINKLHERALRIVYNDHFSSFEELLSKDKSVTVHQRNLQTLATEMYKILNGLSPDIMQDIFETKSNYYNTRNAPAFSSRNIKTVRYGLQTIFYMAQKNLRPCT